MHTVACRGVAYKQILFIMLISMKQTTPNMIVHRQTDPWVYWPLFYLIKFSGEVGLKSFMLSHFHELIQNIFYLYGYRHITTS